MADRPVKVILGVEIGGFKSQMQAAQKSVQDFSAKTSKYIGDNEASINQLSGSFAKFGIAGVAAAGVVVKKFADFDKAMSAVKASGEDAAGSIGDLRKEAIKLGADTQYSATEAADAITAMAKAGVSAKDILGGGLKGALNLAAAGELDVADAAEIAATAMNQFKLEGKDVGHISDLLAAAAGKAMGGVEDMAAAFKYVGPVANQAGISIEETAGTIAYLAQQGVLGDQAGTSLRGMISALTSPSKIAAKTMEELGIEVYDAHGKFIGFEGVAGELQDRMGSLTNAERDAAFGRMFGNEQITTARLLYQGGAKEVANWTTAVDDSGFAARQAAELTDNLAGDVERLGGALDTAFIQGGSGANEALRKMAQGAEAVIDKIGGMDEGILSTTTLLVGTGGLALLGVAGVGKLTTSIGAAKTAATALGWSLKGTAIAAGAVGVALGVGALVLSNWASNAAEARERTDALMNTLDQFGNTTDVTVQELNKKLSGESFGRTFGEWVTGGDKVNVMDWAKSAGIATSDLTGYIMGQGDAVERVTKAVGIYGETWVDGQKQDGKGSALLDILDSESAALTEAQKEVLRKAEADRVAGVEAKGVATATDDTRTALAKYGDEAKNGAASSEKYADAVKEIIDAQRELSGVLLTAREAERGYQASIDDAAKALKDYREGLVEKYEKQGKSTAAAKAMADADVKAGKALDQNTEAGRANQSALDDIVKSGNDVLESQRAQGASGKDLQGVVQRTRDDFIDMAKKMGMSGKEAKALADELGLIPRDVNVDLKVELEKKEAQEALDAFLKSAREQTVVIQAKVDADPTYSPARTSSTIARAAGGPIHGPGTSTSDSILMWASNGEFMVKASSYKKHKGLVEAINADALPAFKDGGAIGASIAERDRLKKAAQRAKTRESNAQKAYDKIGSGKDDKPARTAAKTVLTKAKKNRESAVAAYEDAKSDVSTLRGFKSDYGTDKRRGEGVRSTVNDGGGIDVVDEMFAWADSGAFSKKRTDKLRKSAKSGEKKLLKLYDNLEKTTETLNAIGSVYDSIRGSLASDAMIGDFKSTSSTNALGIQVEKKASSKDALGQKKASAAKIKAFGKALDNLRKKGANEATLQEVAALGAEEGLELANQLLASPSQIAEWNTANNDIAKYSNQAGLAVAKGMAGAEALQLYSDAGGELGSKAVDAIENKVDGIGKSLAASFENALKDDTPLAPKKTTKKAVKKKAAGGSAAAGQPYLVGEEGPELFWPGQPGQIIPSRLTISSMQASQSSNTMQNLDYNRLAQAMVSAAQASPVQVDLIAGLQFQTQAVVNGTHQARKQGATVGGRPL